MMHDVSTMNFSNRTELLEIKFNCIPATGLLFYIALTSCAKNSPDSVLGILWEKPLSGQYFFSGLNSGFRSVGFSPTVNHGPKKARSTLPSALCLMFI